MLPTIWPGVVGQSAIEVLRLMMRPDLLWMPPPETVAELPWSVQLRICAAPLELNPVTATPPPSSALQPVIVQPQIRAELALRWMPPPWVTAVQFSMMQFFTMGDETPIDMPPPLAPRPLRSLSFSMTGWMPPTLNMRRQVVVPPPSMMADPAAPIARSDTLFAPRSTGP